MILMLMAAVAIVGCANTDKLIVACGLKDFMVIDTEKILLVCPRDDKRFAELMSELALPEFSKYR